MRLKMAINDKIPDDDDVSADWWEGSTCAHCSENLVENGVFVTEHADWCPDHPKWDEERNRKDVDINS
jgi:hypothetical protein